MGSSKFRWVHNILWSDPIEDDRAQRDAERDALRDGGDRGPVFGVHASPRNTTAVLSLGDHRRGDEGETMVPGG